MRMQKHVTLLGALFIAFHVLGLIVGIVIMIALPAIGCLAHDAQAMTILSALGVGIGAFLIVLSVPGLVAGIGLLRGKKWSRILSLIVGAFDLFDIPFGTALGVYCFWVLLQDDTMQVFECGKVQVGSGAAGDCSG
ncbi:MAG: hypothetical protein ABIK85_01285 [Candidatus Eisenbacteria bacterium]